MSRDDEAEFLGAISRDERLAAILVDAHGLIRWCNDGVRAIFGHDRAQAVGTSAQALVPPALRSAHLGCFARGFDPSWPGSAGWDAIEGWTAAQSPVALQVFLTPLRDGEGRVAAVLGLFRRPAPDAAPAAAG